MSTFAKKVTSAVAAFAIVFSVVSPIAGVSAAFTSLEAANTLSTLGVIVDQSANPADYRLGDNLPRKEGVKVMMNLSSVAVVDNCAGKFSDLKSTDWACKYAETALANGMVAGNATFGPDRLLSKIEALKMVFQGRDLDRNDNADWRAGYVEAAVEMGVADAAFSDYDAAVTRGQFFIWAANAVDAGDVAGTDDLLCAILGTCEETGTGTTGTGVVTPPVVTGGAIDISLNPMSAAAGTQIPNTGTIRFAKVDLTAGDTDISVNTIDVSSLGLAQVDSSTRVWFEINGKRLSGKAAFSSDRTAVVSFAPAFVVQAGETETLDMYVSLASLTSGNDYQFKGMISSSSASSVMGSFTTNTLRTASYTVAPVTFTPIVTGASYNQSSDLIELGRFTVANNDASSETRDVNFQNITLRQSGNGDVSNLSNLQIERNGVKVSTEVTSNGRDVTFVLNDVVKDGSTATYYIRANVDTVDNTTDSFQFSLRNDTDLNAVEVLNGFRSTVTRASNDLATYNVTGADVVFARDPSVSLSANAAKGTNNVTLLKGTITSKSAITLEDPNIALTLSAGTFSQTFDTVYLKIGSSVMTWTAENGNGLAEFLGLATVNGTADVEIYAKLRDTAPTGTAKFDDIRLSTFTKKEYVSNQNTVSSSVGSISAVTVSVDSTAMSVTRVDGLGNTTIATGGKSVKLYGVKLNVTQGNSVSISNPVFNVVNAGPGTLQLNNVFATLYVDGVAAQTKTVTGPTVSFNSVTKTIATSTPVTLEVVVDLADAFTSGNLTVNLASIDAVDSLTSVNLGAITGPNSATFTVANPVGTLQTSDANPKATLILAGAQAQKLLGFRIKSQFDTIKVRDLRFTGTNLNALSNYRVVDELGNAVAEGASTVTAGVVEFTNITTTDSIASDITKTYFLVADANTNTNVAGVTATLVQLLRLDHLTVLLLYLLVLT